MEPESPRSFKERLSRAVAVMLGQAGYVTESGIYDSNKLADRLFDTVATAEAAKRSERPTVCVTRRALMGEAFPEVPGPEAWPEQDDSELAEHLYKELDRRIWDVVAVSPTAPLQSRLNSDRGLVLCRTKVNPHKTDAVYVTRNRDCIVSDIVEPTQDKQRRQADAAAAVFVMLIQRVPEHAKKWDTDLTLGLRGALNSAKDTTAKALAAVSEPSTTATDDDVDSDDDDGE